MVRAAERGRRDITVKIARAVLFAISLSFAVVGCATVNDAVPLKVNLVNITPASSGVFEQRFIVDLRLSNPNDFAIPLDGLSFEMNVNGEYFATGLSNQRVTIPRLATAVVSVETTANSFDLIRQILNAVQVGAVEYSIKGTAIVRRFGSQTFPFHQRGNLNLVPNPAGPDRLAPSNTRFDH
jgi:LEA14-like dessication related protein